MRHGVFTGYSWGIRGIYVCVGYVSVMYRLCVGYMTEETRSDGANKKDNIDNYFVAPTLCHGEGIYLSTMETINKQ